MRRESVVVDMVRAVEPHTPDWLAANSVFRLGLGLGPPRRINFLNFSPPLFRSSPRACYLLIASIHRSNERQTERRTTEPSRRLRRRVCAALYFLACSSEDFSICGSASWGFAHYTFMSLGGYELSLAINTMPLCIYVRTKCCPEVAAIVGPRVVGIFFSIVPTFLQCLRSIFLLLCPRARTREE